MHCEFCGSDKVVKLPLERFETKDYSVALTSSDPVFYVCRKCGRTTVA